MNGSHTLRRSSIGREPKYGNTVPVEGTATGINGPACAIELVDMVIDG